MHLQPYGQVDPSCAAQGYMGFMVLLDSDIQRSQNSGLHLQSAIFEVLKLGDSLSFAETLSARGWGGVMGCPQVIRASHGLCWLAFAFRGQTYCPGAPASLRLSLTAGDAAGRAGQGLAMQSRLWVSSLQ